jgi:hypothetical protein
MALFAGTTTNVTPIAPFAFSPPGSSSNSSSGDMSSITNLPPLSSSSSTTNTPLQPPTTTTTTTTTSISSISGGGLRYPTNRKTIYDRNLNRSRNAELSRASFAYLFGEMVGYAQRRVTGIQDLEKRWVLFLKNKNKKGNIGFLLRVWAGGLWGLVL